MLARTLGRSVLAIRNRRHRLVDPGLCEQRAAERLERDRRDQEIFAMIERGATAREAADYAGISRVRIWKLLRSKAPHLDLTQSQKRGCERREVRNRIARQIAPALLNAAARGEGLILTAAEVVGVMRSAE